MNDIYPANNLAKNLQIFCRPKLLIAMSEQESQLQSPTMEECESTLKPNQRNSASVMPNRKIGNDSGTKSTSNLFSLHRLSAIPHTTLLYYIIFEI